MAYQKIMPEIFEWKEDQKYELIVQLMKTMQINHLRMLFEIMKQLLSFDVISQLPSETAKIIFSFLDAPSMCVAGACCHKWRELTNVDSLWHKLCQYKNFTGLSYLADSTHPNNPTTTSPVQQYPLTLPLPCHWKTVFMRAYSLEQNWKQGRYLLPPLLRGHSKPVTSIVCDENVIVSGSSDTFARIWCIRSLKCLHVLEGHTDTVNEVVLKDGHIVTACNDGLVRVYDAKSGQLLKSLYGHNGSVEHVAYNGRMAVSGGSDCKIRVWEICSGRLQHTLSGHTEEIECIWLSEEGNRAISGSWDSTMRIWDIEAGICKQLLLSHTEVVYCFVCIDWRIVSGSGDNLVKIWDMECGHVIKTLSGHTQEVVIRIKN